MCFDLLCQVTGLGLMRGLPKLSFEKDLTCLVESIEWSFDKTLCSLLHGALASLVECGACFIVLVSGGVWFLPLRNLVFWLLPS
jgi:hypothetical protein